MSRYRPFGGPIQVASNAAESIRRIDEGVYERILEKATVIGNRINGLKDGLSDEWFATFDLDSPARKRGQVSEPQRLRITSRAERSASLRAGLVGSY